MFVYISAIERGADAKLCVTFQQAVELAIKEEVEAYENEDEIPSELSDAVDLAADGDYAGAMAALDEHFETNGTDDEFVSIVEAEPPLN